MGGRKPQSPRIIPSKPPMGESPGLIGGVIGGARSALLGTPSGPNKRGGRRRSFAEDARRGKLTGIDLTPRLPKFGAELIPPDNYDGKVGRKPLPRGSLRGLATPPPGSEFTDDNRLIKRGSETIYPSKGRRVRGRRSPSRKLTNEEKMRIRSKYEPRRKAREEKGFADRGTIKKGSGRRKLNSCPDPSMLILMSDDTKKKAGELVVGDLVKTCHEKTFELGNYEVEFVDIIKDVEKIKLTFDESTIICSLSHKFYVNDSWKEANDMVIGDVVSDKKLTAIEKVEDGDVIHITVKDAHTYICEGLLSHNKRRISPELRDRLNQERPRGGRGGRGGRRVRKPSAVMETTRVPVKDPTLGGPPEREVPIPKETLPAITRESDPTGPAPFAPNERAMAQDRFFERMFEKADERKQQKSMMREERGRVKQSMRDEMRMRMNEPGEINVGGEININAERRPRPRRRRRMRRMRR